MADPARHRRLAAVNAEADDPRNGDFTTVEDLFDLQMDEGNNEHDRNKATSSPEKECFTTPRKAQTDAPVFNERFAYNMKVNSILVQCGSKRCDATCDGRARQDGPPFGNVAEMAGTIASTWKRQSEALELRPMDSIAYYRKRFDELATVLSLCLFGELPEPQLPPTTSDGVERTPTADNEVKKTGEGKRKRNSTPSNDCEYIFFQKDGKYVYRRVESAVKYAKRNKPTIDSYVCIVPTSEEYRHHTKNCMKKLRAFDAKFASGSELKFFGTYLELATELKLRLERTTLDRFASVKCIEDGENAYGIDENNEITTEKEEDDGPSHALQPPTKKMKTESKSKPTGQSTKAKKSTKTKVQANAEETRRSHVEDYTESDSDSDTAESVSVIAGRNDDQIFKTMETIHSAHGTLQDTMTTNDYEMEQPPSPFLEGAYDRSYIKNGKKKR